MQQQLNALISHLPSHKSDNSIFCYVVIEKSNHISSSITNYTNKIIISSNTSEKTVNSNDLSNSQQCRQNIYTAVTGGNNVDCFDDFKDDAKKS